jgi:hypothetical protein
MTHLFSFDRKEGIDNNGLKHYVGVIRSSCGRDEHPLTYLECDAINLHIHIEHYLKPTIPMEDF